jgi:hypothetical protein
MIKIVANLISSAVMENVAPQTKHAQIINVAPKDKLIKMEYVALKKAAQVVGTNVVQKGRYVVVAVATPYLQNVVKNAEVMIVMIARSVVKMVLA